jgi:hypothetical protein
MVTAALLKMPLRLTKLFAILLEMLLECKETDQSGNFTLALECLDRLVFALGGNTVFKAAEDMLPEYLIDSDCKKRHKALIALARISQSCSTVSL